MLPKNFTVGPSENPITIKKKIFQGGEAEVYECTRADKKCAVKVWTMARRESQSHIRSEIQALHRVPTEYIVKIWDFFFTDDQYQLTEGNDKARFCFVVMERAALGDLTMVIAQRRENTGQIGLHEEEAAHIIRQLLIGLHHAHEKGIIHRDLKTDNILVFSDAKAEQVIVFDSNHKKIATLPIHASETVGQLRFEIAKKLNAPDANMTLVREDDVKLEDGILVSAIANIDAAAVKSTDANRKILKYVEFSLYQVKIADFGFAKVFETENVFRTETGQMDDVGNAVDQAESPSNVMELVNLGKACTQLHLPTNVGPELGQLELRADSYHYDAAVDRWSVGHVTFVMLCAEWPFNTGPRAIWHASIEKMQQGIPFADQMGTPEWRKLSTEAKDFVDKLLTLRPQDRMKVQDAVQHDFLSTKILHPLHGWAEIDHYGIGFSCRCDKNIGSFFSKHTMKNVKCATVKNPALKDCFIGSRNDLLEAPPKDYSIKDWQKVLKRYDDKEFLSVGFKYRQTIVSITDTDGELEWAKRTSFLSFGCQLWYGDRCEIALAYPSGSASPGSFNSPMRTRSSLSEDGEFERDVIGDFEKEILQVEKKDVQLKTLKCCQLRVPEHLDNCVIGPANARKEKHQGWLNLRRVFPELASIVCIVREATNSVIHFPGGADVLKKNDFILFPRQFEGNDGPQGRMHLPSVEKLMDPDKFRLVCNSGAAQVAEPEDFDKILSLSAAPTLHHEFSTKGVHPSGANHSNFQPPPRMGPVMEHAAHVAQARVL